MRITELLQDATIDLGVKVNSKEEAIDHLVDLMVKGGNITDREEYKKGILAREANGTTGIGGGIAIPHSKNKAVTKAGLASMTVPDGVDYEAMDGEPSDVFFMIAAPAEGSDVHLEALSRLSVILMDPVFKDSLLKATSKEEYLALIDKKETEKCNHESHDGADRTCEGRRGTCCTRRESRRWNDQSSCSYSMPNRNRSYIHGSRIS